MGRCRGDHHVGLKDQGDLGLDIASEFMSRPFPAWSAVDVTELYEAAAVVELRVVAAVPRL
jgi:enamine deaminase RidA (YjgF/YER057c/UK114 family)